MNSGGKNKRRFNWKEGNRIKRFHGISEYDNEQYNVSVWDEAHNSQEPYSNSYNHSNRSWGRGRNRYPRFRHNNYNRHLYQHQAFTPPILTDPPTEPEESVVSGPGSETERLEKVLATKKRLEEALASKSSDGNHQEISFQDSAKNTDRVKTNENILEVTGVDLRLTNIDFKEIGSVVTNVATEVEAESSDIVLNTSPCISQQRSFDTTCLNPAPTLSKSPRLGGWNVSAINELVSSEQPAHASLPKTGGEMYFQEKRERILGNVQPTSSQQSIDSTPPRQSASNTNYQHRNKFSRVGRLYQSFLKSRLCGYTLKMRDKPMKLSGPNPLLDKSVLDSQNANDMEKESVASIGNDKILELQMPRPIQVKMENNEGARVNTPEDIAAEEANEFCKEYSFLLTHPNFLIPPEDLEKFGLGHLSEMTRLLNERRNEGTETVPSGNQEGSLRVRSINTLNSVTEHDIMFNQTHYNSVAASTPSSSHLSANVNISRIREPSASDTTNYNQPSSSGTQHQNLFNTSRNRSPAGDFGYQAPNSGMSTSLPQASTRPNISSSDTHNVSIDTVVEEVMKKLLHPSNTSSQVPSLSKQNQLRETHSSTVTNLDESAPSTSKQSSNRLESISSQLLTMFLIDKQIEELTQKKMKIYNEMLSAKEISSALLNSWAQDQIQQGNVRNLAASTTVHSSTPAVYELSGVMDKSIHENLSVNLGGTIDKNHLQDAISELVALKQEEVVTKITLLNSMKAENCLLPCGIELQDTVSSTPVSSNLENNLPKLSVRKDLHDPNISRRLCDEENVLDKQAGMESSSELSSNSGKRTQLNANSGDAQSKSFTDKLKHTNFSEQKALKRKKKKEASNCVIDLVGDTSDEEMCSVSQEGSVTGVDPLPSEEAIYPGYSEDNVNSNVPSVTTSEKSIVHLGEHTATCMAKKGKTVIVGTKEGYVIFFSVINMRQRFIKKIHSEPILCMQVINTCILTGSADSTICVFSVENLHCKKSHQVNAPVQCFDYRYGCIFGGTKNGFLNINKLNEKKCALKKGKKSIQLTNSSIVALKVFKEGTEILVIIASRGEQVTVRSITSGAILRTFDWCDTVYCLELFGGLVYCGTNTKSVKVVNYSNGENANDCQVGRAVVQILFYRKFMFAACYDGKLYAYDTKKQRLVTSWVVTKGIIVSMAIHKCHKIFVVDNRKEIHIIPFPYELTPQSGKQKKNKSKQ